MPRPSSTGGVRPNGDKIAIRFTWKGKQVAPTLNLKPTGPNLKAAARMRVAILDEIKHGTFQFATYFPDYKHIESHESPADARKRTFGEWVALWEKISARDLENSTLSIYKRHTAAYWLPKWKDLPPERITHEMVLTRLADLAAPSVDEVTGRVHKGLSRKTQNNIMIPLRGVFEFICKPPSQVHNPCEGIDNLKSQKKEPDPFSPDEVELILKTMRKLEGDELADYFEFSFFTGLRASEQVALLWSDVDLHASTLMIRHVKVLTESKDRTKTHVARLVEMNDRAVAVIQRQRARTQMRDAEVFWNPKTGKIYRDEQTQRLAFKRTLRVCGVRYRAPKECRDTSVTLALMAGAMPTWVAMQHGHSVTVMMKDYARWIPKADGGSNLAAVNKSLGRKPNRKAANE